MPVDRCYMFNMLCMLIMEPAINTVLVLMISANNGGSYRLQEHLLLAHTKYGNR